MKTDPLQADGLVRTLLALLLVLALAGTSLYILKPFLMAMVWAVMIVIATWPHMRRMQARCRGSRPLAVVAMTLLLVLLLVAPLALVAATVASHSMAVAGWIRSLATVPPPPLPAWVTSLPMVGARLALRWQHLRELGPDGLSALLVPYAQKALRGLLEAIGTVGKMAVQSLLTLFIAAVLYLRGDRGAAWMCRFARRIAGHYGESSILLAGQAIQAVALGVVGTAVVHTVFTGVGLAICGIPGAGILTVLAFLLSLAQIGPFPVLVLGVAWLFWTGQTGWAIALAAWTILEGVVSGIISPILMKRGVDLPMLLVFAGVTGGLMVFGVIGLFIGPVVLAITYSLLDAWVTGEEPVPEAAAPPAEPS